MLYICDIRLNTYGVRDTKDGVVEYVSLQQIKKITSKLGIKIHGVNRDGSISIYEFNYKSMIDDFFRLMDRAGGGGYNKERDNENGTASIRHWGDWELPEDCYDDEEDYDFEVLSREWRAKLRGVLNELAKKYPDFIFRADTSEKNWIDLEISVR